MTNFIKFSTFGNGVFISDKDTTIFVSKKEMIFHYPYQVNDKINGDLFTTDIKNLFDVVHELNVQGILRPSVLEVLLQLTRCE